MPARLRIGPGTARWIGAGLLLVLLAGVPLIFSGPGNDLDVANIFRSGRSIVDQHTYLASRAPGAPVHESIVGVADRLGGPALVNLTSLAAAVVFVVGLDRLMSGEGLGPNRRWAIAVVVANPWFVVAATSAVDYLFALAFVVWSAVALRSGRLVAAGVLAGLSMGCRVGSAMLIAAVLVAELTDGQPDGESNDEASAPEFATRFRRVVTVGAITAVVAVVLMIPSYLASDGFSFAQNDFHTATPLVHLGRSAVKNVALLGPVSCVVALLAIPSIGRALRSWRSSWLIRFAVVGFVASEALFIRFPWKVSHLLPALVCGAVALALALRNHPRLLVALACLQLLSCVVQVKVFSPDRPNQAEGAKVGFEVTWGQVVTDWQCRRNHPDAYRGRQKVEVEAAWGCSQPFAWDDHR
ncbi:MAG: hypothetical protein KDB02_11580 [Acidimicrobiales bacterium]|nr:hypothetical protein [Acidimicrobiales bacterium]